MANGERPPVPATYYTRTEPSEVRLMKVWLNGPWPMHRILARLHLNHGIIIINFFFLVLSLTLLAFMTHKSTCAITK